MENSIIEILNMEPHSVIEVHNVPYFRVLKVHSGWLYNFWDEGKEDYGREWVFVPVKN